MSLNKTIRSIREELGYSRADFSEVLGISKPYLASLENDESRTPSLQFIQRLIEIVKSNHKDPNISIQLASAVTGVELPLLTKSGLDLEHELQSQSKLDRDSEVWVITDRIAEALDRDYAKLTASDHIQNGEVKYKFFVPLTSQDDHWMRAISWMKEFTDDELIEASVEVFKMSDVAFSSRIRIKNPTTLSEEGVYFLSPAGERNGLFFPAPKAQIQQLTTTLTELIISIGEGEDEVCNNNLGRLKAVFGVRSNG